MLNFFQKNSQARKVLAKGIHDFNNEYNKDLYIQAIYYGGTIDSYGFDSTYVDMINNFAIIDYNDEEKRYRVLNRDSINNYITKGQIDSARVKDFFNTIEKKCKGYRLSS